MKDARYRLCGVRRRWSHSDRAMSTELEVLGVFGTRAAAEESMRERYAAVAKLSLPIDPQYVVVGPMKWRDHIAERARLVAARRSRGQTRAAEERKKNGSERRFVLCPTCRAKSKLLRSEMGGLQTRRCQGGHVFEHDKWIADRAIWAFVR